jgi:uncharacterized protein
MTTNDLIEHVTALPVGQRAELVEVLLRTLDKPQTGKPGESVPPGPTGANRTADPDTMAVLRAFRGRMAQRYGNRLRGMVLFGSRARGDHRADSDADVAVFLDPVSDPVAAQMDMAEDAYRLFLDCGLLIQPWVFRGSPDRPDASRALPLLEEVRSEGIRV